MSIRPAGPERRRSTFVEPAVGADPIVHGAPRGSEPNGRGRRAANRPARRVMPADIVLGPDAPIAVDADAAARADDGDRSGGRTIRRIVSRTSAVAALLFAGGLVVATTVPAQAFLLGAAGGGADASTASSQSFAAGGAADGVTTRDPYSVTDLSIGYANTADTFTNDPNGTIQWPFLVGVPITSGFGGRNVEGCSFCSTFHEGADFAPGAGTPIRVVADGTVTKVQADDGGYGNDVWVTHDVDGKQFVSVYGHMQDDSFKVVEGQRVKVGDELGLVGSTGNSTGPHLHLEIHVNDVPVDPIAWLRANAN
jgi:murein DD-endopeptidase MepM/ murein hydrolase activator NlpD